MKETVTIHTNIGERYVSHWTVHDALRELFQNAIDTGHMECHYPPEEGKLSVSTLSSEVDLDRRTLALGTSIKTSEDSRGQFGEGYKLACLVLLRNGMPVTIHTLKEKWVPKLEMNMDLGVKTLSFGILPDVHSDNIVFQIENVSIEDWNVCRKNILQLGKYPDHFETITDKGKVRVLKDKEQVGRLYVGGIFVSMYRGLSYGFDFSPGMLELGRDRKMVNGHQLLWHTSKTVCDLLDNDTDKVLEMLEKGSEELYSSSSLSPKEKDKIYDALSSKHGEETIFLDKWEDNMYPEDTPIKRVSSFAASAVQGSDKYKERESKLEKIKPPTIESTMEEWLSEYEEYMPSKVLKAYGTLQDDITTLVRKYY